MCYYVVGHHKHGYDLCIVTALDCRGPLENVSLYFHASPANAPHYTHRVCMILCDFDKIIQILEKSVRHRNNSFDIKLCNLRDILRYALFMDD